MRAMMYRGGDNPYATEYNAEAAKQMEKEIDRGQQLNDKASSFVDKAKSYSF